MVRQRGNFKRACVVGPPEAVSYVLIFVLLYKTGRCQRHLPLTTRADGEGLEVSTKPPEQASLL
ncbi:MAG: hypothetical protein DRP51_02475 [Candidatus Zixiibacteriota bacterium]|nr:MAG: hypothetical protein DRP51_02475 [candidate division Zixibacteria bacterium]HHI03461.1 hypothetical protein [candidate division Zixibacteria bacterium]